MRWTAYLLVAGCGAANGQAPEAAPDVAAPVVEIDDGAAAAVTEVLVSTPAPAHYLTAPRDAATGDGDPCTPSDADRLYTGIVAQAASQFGDEVAVAAFGCRKLGEAQAMAIPVQLTPGSCVAAVAIGDGGTLEMSLRPNLEGAAGALPPGLAGFVLATGSPTRDGVTLLGEEGCFTNPMPLTMPAILEVKAPTGGHVAIASYVR